MSVRKSQENYRQIYGKSKASLWRNLSTGTPPKFFRTILCFVALVYNWYIFFRTTVLRKLFDIRFSHKHCNFPLVYLLVKMASKTMTRSVRMINRKKLKLSILSFKVHIIILNIIIKNVLLLTDSEKLLDLNVVLEAKRQGNQWKWGQIRFVVSVCHSLFRMVRLRSWKEIKKRFLKRKRI